MHPIGYFPVCDGRRSFEKSGMRRLFYALKPVHDREAGVVLAKFRAGMSREAAEVKVAVKIDISQVDELILRPDAPVIGQRVL